jgi:D-alanine-D-alanine ligase
MRIAFCHNLKTSDSLEEAEYDTPQTVDRIRAALEAGGHDVHPVSMNGPLSLVAARLESLSPELIFNTAEGRAGRFREAFFPALFEHLGIPFTGGGAFCCAVTLDKLETKARVQRHGVPTPRALLVTAETLTARLPALGELTFPVLVKPNFEGSSVGISSDGVFLDPGRLERALPLLLERYPAGILAEEFIEGRDVTVGFLEILDPPVLDPTGYTYLNRGKNPYNIYDYRLKNQASDEVRVDLDPKLPPDLKEKIREWTRLSAKALEFRDVGRFDFRISKDSAAYFLEANATPSLEEGAGLLLQAEKRGLSFQDTILGIVESAARRQGIKGSARKGRPPSPRESAAPGVATGRGRKARRIGLTFNLKRSDTHEDDREAEFDSPKTISGLRGALEELGFEVMELEAGRELPIRLAASEVDLVFNIAEGARGRSRESQVPALCELLDMPFTGSDAATLAICLDKSVTKRLLLQAGIPTPGFFLLKTGKEELPADLRFPVILKPNAEGTSKGLDSKSVVETEGALRALAAKLVEHYEQPAIVEEYISGREITVGLVGWPEARILEPMEVVLTEPGVKHRVYHYQLKQDFTRFTEFRCPAEVTAAQREALGRMAREAYETLGCLDIARIDFRLSEDGAPFVIEVNPLPGLCPGFSDLCLIAAGSGLSYVGLIQEIVNGALRRFGRG